MTSNNNEIKYKNSKKKMGKGKNNGEKANTSNKNKVCHFTSKPKYEGQTDGLYYFFLHCFSCFLCVQYDYTYR